jgi:hypothetical protein
MKNQLFSVLAGTLIFALSGASISGTTSQVLAQEGSRHITIGVELTLGMSEDSAIKKLAEAGYHVRKVNPPEQSKKLGVTSIWLIDDQTPESKSAPAIGVITIAGGKLRSASRDWLPDDRGEGVQFGRQLYFLFRQLETDGNEKCTIKTTSAESPDFAEKEAILRCGTKSVSVELQKYKDNHETVQLSEQLNRTEF